MKQVKVVSALSLAGLTIATSVSSQAASVHPVVDLRTGYLMGGSINGKWRQAPEIAKSMGAQTTYRAYRFDRRLVDVIGGKPASQGAPCDETLFVTTRRTAAKSNRPFYKEGDNAFAISGNWNALPRIPRAMSTTQPVYRKAVADILKRHGITQPEVKITQVWRVDLDGDREAEVLITASRYKANGNSISPDSSNGDYSVTFLRKMVRGKLKTIILSEEYHPVGAKFNAPNFFKLAGVLDTNGDGKMEILVRGEYYEGGWISAFSSSGDKVTEVLGAACGA